MSTNRREFLRTGTIAALGLSLPFRGKSSVYDAYKPKGIATFGIQLWTVKEDMARDPKGTLAALSKDGYRQIESFEGQNGMFWGMSNKAFKKYLDGLNMRIISSHCDISKDFERKSAEAAEIGMKYLVCPYKGPQKNIDSFKTFADEFNKAGEICKKNGLRFAYHNHDYSFKPVDGKIPQDVMMGNTDKALVDFEMDIYWVVAAGADPEEYFKKYPNRFRLCHVKDLARTAKGEESVQLGKGTINFQKILKTGVKYGLTYFIVEQEAFTGSSPLESAKADARYFKTITI